MDRVVATILAFMLVAGQATAASASSPESRTTYKVTVCAAPTKASKATKIAKVARVANRCKSTMRSDSFVPAPLVLGGAAVAIAGVVAAAASAGHDSPASP
jgi:hypothetical protein